MTTSVPHSLPRITAWDRAAVIALGAAGCALSYDALQQMAVAIHVRGVLTYLFPLVIDGFIAYGVRALVVLRDAPLRARLYTWSLFGVATGASIWANALHALRLNQQSLTPPAGLRLGDTVVATLSTLAPLALAGAVHLYILIARRPVEHGDRAGQTDRGQRGRWGQPGHSLDTGMDRPGREGRPRQDTEETSGSRPSPDKRRPKDARRAALSGVPADGAGADAAVPPGRHGSVSEGGDLGGQPDNAPSPATRPATRSAGGRRVVPDTEELLQIAWAAVRTENKLTRKVVAEAIRGQRIPLSNDRLTVLMVHLREQRGRPVTSVPN
ncbi:DUF2637 domain-containing protein [Streptomyces sp. B6B3]|uniref:DUF2637 domain-containing protein n=1 Tax=Streptomyces sp. B6B3 TaxID=3153570 RepID=UPI00325DA705